LVSWRTSITFCASSAHASRSSRSPRPDPTSSSSPVFSRCGEREEERREPFGERASCSSMAARAVEPFSATSTPLRRPLADEVVVVVVVMVVMTLDEPRWGERDPW
jgi:hypothetical protein